MASPQTEDGFVKIANELYEQILLFKFTKRELLIVMAVIRLTYGFNKLQDDIANYQLSKMTNISTSRISETLTKLAVMRVLTVVKSATVVRGVVINRIGMNKDYEQWGTVAKLATVADDDGSQNGNRREGDDGCQNGNGDGSQIGNGQPVDNPVDNFDSQSHDSSQIGNGNGCQNGRPTVAELATTINIAKDNKDISKNGEKSACPETFKPDQTVEASLKRAGVVFGWQDPAQIQTFICHHQAVGTYTRNWQAMYAKWCIRAAGFNQSGPTPGTGDNFHDQLKQFAGRDD